MTEKLTDRLVRSLAAPERGNKITYDTEVKGFGIRITARDARSFVLNYRVGSRERRYTVGSYPDWSVQAAREEARCLKRGVDLGHDHVGTRHAERSIPNAAELAKRYLREHAARKAQKSQAEDTFMIERFILPAFGRLKVTDVQHDDVDRLHREVSESKPIRANRIAQLLSKMFSLAIRWGYRADNPVKGLVRNPETKRQRYLSRDELQRLVTVLDEHPRQPTANVIRFLLLTGARRGEALNATWDQFDLDAGLWIKPSAHTKLRKQHRVPLSQAAMTLLHQINEGADLTEPYVFPGNRPGEPLKEIKTFWATVCRRAQLGDFRVHDLRHSYASILASAGLSLPIIGALLGHTQPGTTARYSHLFDDPLRETTERVANVVSKQP